MNSIILELPKESIQEIKIGDYSYSLDLLDFNKTKKIEEIYNSFDKNIILSSKKEDLKHVMESCQIAFKSLFDTEIHFSNDNFYKDVFYCVAIMKQIYELIIDFRNDYLNSNYPIVKDTELDKCLKITQSLENVAKVLKDVEA